MYLKKIIYLITFLLIFFSTTILSQNKKQIEITKTDVAPKVDGNLNELCWEKANVAQNFILLEPYNGKAAPLKTEVKVIYDNNAIYVGAYMYDEHPDSIFRTLTKRDEGFEVDADEFVVQFNTFNDGINANLFGITAAGVQTDIKASGFNEDPNWNAVWDSEVSITDKGWVAEFKIPYSALRFSGEEKQTWEVNFFRRIVRKQEWSSWNWVNNQIDGIFNQAGELTGIENIKPPIRLSFTPYLSTYTQHSSEGDTWNSGIKGGMDLKYGISESFTLDMMLIPDFSQVQTDDQVLNLSAFEIRYDENRPFFTEGTELFEKGEIFYSKRIGSYPKYGDQVDDYLNDNEEVIENPIETKIVNATKITGRTEKGLGVGFFNAITLQSNAKIRDSITNSERNYTTQPLTNYNIVAFDQSLKNNSYISLINTNMIIPDNKYTANVTASEFLIRTKKQHLLLKGIGAVSQIYEKNQETDYGFKYEIGFAKTAGNIRYSVAQELVDDKFNPNDMGYLSRGNYIETDADISYRTLQPKGKLLEWLIRIDTEYEQQYNTLNYIKWKFGGNAYAKFTNHWSLSIFADMIPLGEDDYYESREDGQVFKESPEAYAGISINSDRRKRFSFGAFFMLLKKDSEYNQKLYEFEFAPTWRVNDKLRFSANSLLFVEFDDLGYVENENDVIYFGRRDRKTVANTMVIDFTFNNKMAFSLRGRHYWSSAKYHQFFSLENDGTLNQNTTFENNADINYNAFNIDMVYNWRFAPGSDLLIVWKNSVYKENEVVETDYLRNLEGVFSAPQTNLFSIKILYYLDYLYLKRKS